jgi:CobB/CobQ-like glutamine amidotransferase domain
MTCSDCIKLMTLVMLFTLTGWAAALRFDDRIRRQFDDFRLRSDTFSLGVCNGCQLLALLGWVGSDEDDKGLRYPVSMKTLMVLLTSKGLDIAASCSDFL